MSLLLLFNQAGAGGSYSLTANAGAYVETGVNGDLLKASVLTAADGSFSLAGVDITFFFSLLLAADTGAFGLNGQNANLNKGSILSAAQGSFALGGVAAITAVTRTIAAVNAAFALNGVAAGLNRGITLGADVAAYTLLGRAAGLIFDNGGPGLDELLLSTTLSIVEGADVQINLITNAIQSTIVQALTTQLNIVPE